MYEKAMITIGVLVVLVLALAIGSCAASTIVTGNDTVTVESKERIAEGSDGKWMVFATDGQTFEVTDNLFYGLFDSTDRYRALEVGGTYDCGTIGFRWPFLSMYKNLRDCDEVTP